MEVMNILIDLNKIDEYINGFENSQIRKTGSIVNIRKERNCCCHLY